MPSHQNEIASLLHPVGAKHFFWPAKRWNPPDRPRSESVRIPQRTALSLTIPPMLLALADEVMK
jgi:hypothetical protein